MSCLLNKIYMDGAMKIGNPVFSLALAGLLIGGCQTTGGKPEQSLVQQRFQSAVSLARTGKAGEACAMFIELAASGDAPSQYNAGRCYDLGEGVPRDYGLAVKWYGLAAEQRIPDAMYHMGIMYHEGFGVPKDLAKAYHWWRKAAESGVPMAQYNIGDAFAQKGEYNSAAAWYEKSASQGYYKAHYAMGVLCSRGLGVPVDKSRAANYYEKAAIQGDEKAQFNLGLMYATGDGIPKDKHLARQWLSRAEQAGHPKARIAIQQLLK